MNPVKHRELVEAFAEACEADDFSRISETWSHFFYDLHGARGVFVVGDTKYDKPVLPTDVFFDGKCALLGILKSRQLGLIQNRGSSRPFNYAPYIFADTNFVSYCNAVHSRRNLGANTDSFYAAGDRLMPLKDSLGAMCYLVENFERRHLPQVRESVKAFAAFKFADPDVFRRDRAIRPTVSDEKLEEVTGEIMANLETRDFQTLYEPMRLYYLSSRIALTKIAAIDFCLGGAKSPKQKLLKLLEYFDQEVAMLPQIELLIAWRYYQFKSQEPFFKTIQRNASDLLGSIHSMSWDLAHWRNVMMLITATGHLGSNAHFPIPYFLTFDRGFARLVQQVQLKGIIFLGSGMRYIAVPDSHNLQSFSDVLESAEHMLTPAAVAKRQQRRPADDTLAAHFDRLVQASTKELLSVINRSGPT